MIVDQREDLTIDNIDEKKYYNMSQISKITGLHKTSITRKCDSWEIKYINFWNSSRKIRVVKWIDLINFLNK